VPDLSSGPGAAVTLAAAPPFWWVAPLVTGLAALTAAIIAVTAILANRKMVRLRASLDLIERTESQQFYQDLRNAFRDAARANFENLSDDLRQKVLMLLNHYEIIAIGCRHNVLDKKFYADWMRSALVRDWRRVENFVWALRHPPNRPPLPGLFEHFENLAREWERQIIQ
jgi:hypothetical protein